jgi:hypothetical protein
VVILDVSRKRKILRLSGQSNIDPFLTDEVAFGFQAKAGGAGMGALEKPSSALKT